MPHVLLVDDEKNVLMTLSIGLKRQGFKVDKALNGPEALNLLKGSKYDCMVSDIKMVPMDGYTLAAEVHRTYPKLPIVLMSAYGFDSDRHRKGYYQITKPFEVADLAALIRDRILGGVNETMPRFLVASTEHSRARLREALDEGGINAVWLAPDSDFIRCLRDVVVSAYIIEDRFLAGDGWKILNAVEQVAPDRPVIILRHEGEAKRPTESGPDVRYLDIDRLLQAPRKAATFLKKEIRNA